MKKKKKKKKKKNWQEKPEFCFLHAHADTYIHFLRN